MGAEWRRVSSLDSKQLFIPRVVVVVVVVIPVITWGQSERRYRIRQRIIRVEEVYEGRRFADRITYTTNTVFDSCGSMTIE